MPSAQPARVRGASCDCHESVMMDNGLILLGYRFMVVS